MFALPLRLFGLGRPIMWFAEEEVIEDEEKDFEDGMGFPLDKSPADKEDDKTKEEDKKKEEEAAKEKEAKEKAEKEKEDKEKKDELSEEELLNKPDNELSKEQLEQKNTLKTEYEAEKKRILETEDKELNDDEKELKKQFQEQGKKEKKPFIDMEDPNLSEEDREQLSPREKAFYYRYHTEKKKRQEFEAKQDKLLLEVQELKKTVTPKEKDIIEEILKDKAEDDTVTVAEVKKILAQRKEKDSEKEDKKKVSDEKIQAMVRAAQEKADRQQKEFEADHPDFKEKMNIFGKALKDNEELAIGLFNEAQKQDGNVARYVYEKGKKFEKLYGAAGGDDKKTDKDSKNEFNLASRIIQNSKKRKTTAGRGSNAGKGEGYTNEDLEAMEIDELASTLDKMPMEEYQKVPRHIRKRALGEE